MSAAACLPDLAPPILVRVEAVELHIGGHGDQLDPIAEATVREALDRVLAASEDRLGALADALRTRQINAAEWERRMRLATKDALLQGTAAARGGWAQLSPADYGRVGAEARRQYAYLRRFRRQLEAGEVALDGRFAARMGLYLQAGRPLFEAVREREQRARGMSEYRNVRHAADSCGGCVAATAAGWVPAGSLPPVGARDCGARCRCTFDYRAGAPDPQADGG